MLIYNVFCTRQKFQLKLNRNIKLDWKLKDLRNKHYCVLYIVATEMSVQPYLLNPHNDVIARFLCGVIFKVQCNIKEHKRLKEFPILLRSFQQTLETLLL